eukprot:4047555-Prymnesium_polylepis.1
MWCSHTALRAPYPSPVHPWLVWGRWFRVASAWVGVTLPNLKIDRFPSTSAAASLLLEPTAYAAKGETLSLKEWRNLSCLELKPVLPRPRTR